MKKLILIGFVCFFSLAALSQRAPVPTYMDGYTLGAQEAEALKATIAEEGHVVYLLKWFHRYPLAVGYQGLNLITMRQ